MRNFVKEKPRNEAVAVEAWMSIMNPSVAHVDACRASSVAPRIALSRSVNHLYSLIEMGFRFIGVGSDTGFLATGCMEGLKKIKM